MVIRDSRGDGTGTPISNFNFGLQGWVVGFGGFEAISFIINLPRRVTWKYGNCEN